MNNKCSWVWMKEIGFHVYLFVSFTFNELQDNRAFGGKSR